MLVELPNGDWINALEVDRIIFNSATKTADIHRADNIRIVSVGYGDDPEATKAWIKSFAKQCNYYKRLSLKPPRSDGT